MSGKSRSRDSCEDSGSAPTGPDLCDLLAYKGTDKIVSPDQASPIQSAAALVPANPLNRPLTHEDVYALVAIAMDRQSRAQSPTAPDQPPSIDEISDIVSQVAKITREDALAVIRDYRSGNLSASERSAIVEFAGGKRLGLKAAPSPKRSWYEYGQGMALRILDNPGKVGLGVGAVVYLGAALTSPLGFLSGVPIFLGAVASALGAASTARLQDKSPQYILWKFNQSLDEIAESPSPLDREARTQVAFKQFYGDLLRVDHDSWKPRDFDGDFLYGKIRELKVPLRDGARVLEGIFSEGGTFRGYQFIFPDDRNRRHELEALAVSYVDRIARYQVTIDDALSILSQAAKRVESRNPQKIVEDSIALIESSRKYIG